MDMFRVEIYISMLRIYCHVREFMDTFIVVRLRVYGHVHCWVFMNTFVNEIMNMLALRGSKHFNY